MGCRFFSEERVTTGGHTVTEHSAPATTKPEIDGHRLAEFVYGVVTGMVAIPGIGGHPAQGWVGTAAIVVAGAIVIWLAHGYALMLSRRVTSGRRLTARDIAETFAGSWPIVIAGILSRSPYWHAALACGASRPA